MFKRLSHLINSFKSVFGLIPLTLYKRRFAYQPTPEKSVFDLFKKKLCQVKTLDDRLLIDYKINLVYDFTSDIGAQLYSNGHFEKDDINSLSKRLLPKIDPVILDIGANIGIHTLEFAKNLPNAFIYSFEPSNNTSNILQQNIKLNGIENRVEVLKKAVSNQVGTLLFYEADDNAYSSLKDTKRKNIVAKNEVAVTTIDQFVVNANIKKIDLIKIDVEGYEHEVLEGGIQTFLNYKPDIFVEIYGGVNSNLKPEATIKLMVQLGYTAYIMQHGVLTPFVKHSDRLYNYLFTFSPTNHNESNN